MRTSILVLVVAATAASYNQSLAQGNRVPTAPAASGSRGARASSATVLTTAFRHNRVTPSVNAVAGTSQERISHASTIDTAKSQVAIHVHKAGLLSFIAGHTHEVAGPVGGTVDVPEDVRSSRIHVVIDSAALKVKPDDEPPGDAPKVQATMDDKVLEVSRYPAITFDSTAITVQSHDGEHYQLTLTGMLTVRNITRTVTVPVQAELSSSTLTATGRLSIKQRDYGITPITVAGVVKVADALDVEFTIQANR